ncbi:FAD-binding oxidoreductase [Trinickia sp. LjRoot230]|uniref:NAD(P)/FAD-dependent oxidoreductase n=1 Tax=Trinickia sp. LjRoot230 TaxID=3342288 RepID=UPI003ECD81E6
MHAPARSYYEATVVRPSLPSLDTQTGEAEVCIVGGGFAGLSTALGLVERSQRDVVVLEGERVGFGASGRNGGFVFGGFSLDNIELLRRVGAHGARALYALTTGAVETIRSRIARYEIDCDAVYAGIILADWFNNTAALDAQRALMRASFGIDWQPIAKPDLRRRLLSDRYHDGLFEPHGFHFHPLKYVLGMTRALTGAGVRVYEHSPVVSIERVHNRFLIRTPNGTVSARQVIMATGAYSRGVYRRVERAVLPIATYVIATEPLGRRLQEAIACRSAVYDTRFAFDYYRPLPDTRLLWGGRISIFERKPEQISRLLARDMLRVYPQLRGTRIDYAWSGLMSYARHKMPQIGRSTDGIWHAVGFGGHGVAPTTAAGELLAAAIAEDIPLPQALQQFGLHPTYGRLGLAAAELTYLMRIGRDTLFERLVRRR